jgi:hypothetical protein
MPTVRPAEAPDHPLAWVLSLPDDEMIDEVARWWLAAQTEAKGIPLEHFSPQLAQVIWLETLNAIADSAGNADLLQAMQAYARGDKVRAAKLFREAIVGRVIDMITLKKVSVYHHQQSVNAKGEREGLTRIIRPWIKKDPNISTEKVLDKLKVLEKIGHEVIREVTDEVIRVASQKLVKGEVIEVIGKVEISSLPAIISRVRKKLGNGV